MNVDTKRQRLTLLVEQWMSQARDFRIVADNTHLPRPARIRALGQAEGLEVAARKLQTVLDDLGRDGG